MAEIFQDNQYLTSRGATFEELRNDGTHSDVVIVTRDGSKFPCHKIILIGGCPFFRGLFASDMVESRQTEVNLNPIDISGSLFKQILEFIYTGRIKLNFEDAKAMNIYAGLFTMTNLKNFTESCLMKNIRNETCLELWRHSEKYLNDKLKDACMLSANSEVFLNTHVENLTMEEIKCIVSLKKLNSKILLQNIVKWIKIDFKDRQRYIKCLMELTNFDVIKDKEFERQIFSDEILRESNQFLKLSVDYFLRPPSNSDSTPPETAVYVPNKTLFVVTENKIFSTDFDTKKFIATKLCSELSSFGMSSHPTNGFLITGGLKNEAPVDLCTQFCPGTGLKKEFPRLKEARYYNRNCTINNEIYTCGGTSSTVEIFNSNVGKWMGGPTMNYLRSGFSLADDSKNTIYAIGDTIDRNYLCRTIHRYDTRMSSWETTYTDSSMIIGFNQSLYKDDKIYSFGFSNGFIFDIRANKYYGQISYTLDSTKDVSTDGKKFGCSVVDNDIWIIGKLYVNNREEIPNVFKWDLKRRTFERKMFNGLDEIEEIGLIWCKND